MNRRKCAITYDGQTIDYDFSNALFSSSSPTLDGHISAICTKFDIEENSDSFALEVCKTQDLVSYLEAGDLVPQKLAAIFSVNKKITLTKKPEYVADELLSHLKDPHFEEKNKVLFDLGKVHVKNLSFCQQLLDFDGFRVILDHCHSSSSGLSNGLTAIENYLAYFPDHPLCSLTLDDVNFIVSLFDHSNLTIVKSALRVLIQACYTAPKTLLFIQSGVITQAEIKEREPYSIFLQHLETQDVSVCTLTLRMLNIILSNADQQSRTQTFLHLHRLGANYALRKLAHGNPAILSELYLFQKLKLKVYEDESKISYDKANEEHERCLMLLWSLVFPNIELESRVSEQWKLMGFQGTDPATDFRGMGICGLNNLLYFAQHHTELLRKYCTEQQGRGLALYPVATAAINVSQLMFQIFELGKLPKKEGNNGPGGGGGGGGKSGGVGVGEGGEKVFLILFDVEYDHPFEEAYSIVFQLFDYTWNAMKATYMDYPNVIKAVLEKVTNLIINCTSVAQFQKVVALEMETPLPSSSTATVRGTSCVTGNTELSFIHQSVTASVKNTVENQKISIMKEGECFQALAWSGEGKTVRLECNKYRVLILNEEGTTLNWADLSDFEPPSDLNGLLEGSEMNSIPLKNIVDITFGASSRCYQNFKGKFKDDGLPHFTICIEYTPDAGAAGGAMVGGPRESKKGRGSTVEGCMLECVARSKETFVSWISGLQVWTNQKMSLPELEEEISTLVKISYELRMLDLEDFGAMIAKEPVQRPEEPDDYLFKMDDNESIMTTEDGLIPVPKKKMLVGGAGRVGVAQK